MPLYSRKCVDPACGESFEVYLPIARYEERPPCPACGGATERHWTPLAATTTAAAVVVFRTPDGTYRFPGDPNGRTAKQYENMGYIREEKRGAAEVRALEKSVNRKEFEAIQKRVERHQRVREQGTALRRSDLNNAMANGCQIPETRVNAQGQVVRTGRMKTVRYSDFGRAVARATMARHDAKPGPQTYEPGFHVEAYSYDRSNREASYGPDGRRRRD